MQGLTSQNVHVGTVVCYRPLIVPFLLLICYPYISLHKFGMYYYSWDQYNYQQHFGIR